MSNLLKNVIKALLFTVVIGILLLNTTSASASITAEYLGFVPDSHIPPRGPQGLVHLTKYTIKTGNSNWIIMDSIHSIVSNNGNGNLVPVSFDDFDIRWQEVKVELSSSPEEKEPEIIVKVPVYNEGVFAGYIIDSHYHKKFPDAIAYMVIKREIKKNN